jgi:hypothetical protein
MGSRKHALRTTAREDLFNAVKAFLPGHFHPDFAAFADRQDPRNDPAFAAALLQWASARVGSARVGRTNEEYGAMRSAVWGA